jgi:hypothetical protein
MLRRLTWTTALCAVVTAALAGGEQPLTKRDADSLEKKLTAMLARGAMAGAAGRPLRTVISDREVNAYFKFQGAEQLPVGVLNPSITLLDAGRFSGVATVDLSVVRRAKERPWSDPLAYISGSLEIRAVGRLRGANGKGLFDLESATLAGVSIPKALLQEIVSYYSKTPESPGGFALDQPFDLPQKIRQVDLQRGAAVIVQ